MAGGIGSLRGFAYGAVGPNAIYQDKYGQWYQSTDVVGGNAMAVQQAWNLLFQPHLLEIKAVNSVRTLTFR